MTDAKGATILVCHMAAVWRAARSQPLACAVETTHFIDNNMTEETR